MTDVVFKYVSWPFNQKDFRGNFIIENEHKVTKSTIAFPFNSLCESICRMRNYCARYCTSIQQIRILTILNLEGYIRRKKKNYTDTDVRQAYSELEKNFWHIVIFELLKQQPKMQGNLIIVGKNLYNPALVGISRLKNSQLYVQAGPIQWMVSSYFQNLLAYSFWKILKKSFLYFQNANVGPVYEIDWVNWSQ